MKKTFSRAVLLLALLGGPFSCLPHAGVRATTAAIGGLFAYDLDQCIEKGGTWAAFDACEAALRACAREAKTVGEYDACSDKVTR